MKHGTKHDEKKINKELEQGEELIENTISDTRQVIQLIKIEKPKEITIIISNKWKYELYKEFKEIFERTRNVSEVIKEVMKNIELRKYGQEVIK